jgi:ubiquinone/menaquinone biosynthesis C-methylase UbiE
MNPDFSKTASDYSRHRQGFPDELFEVLTEFGIVLKESRAVDLGTGTGTLARGMARRGAIVTGIDPSSNLTEEAQRLDLEWGVATRYVNRSAESTGLDSGGFDVVTSGQSWWWFDAPAALAEVRCILRPGGTLTICSFDWVPAPGNVVELTEQLIKKHNPQWDMGGGNGLHPEFVTDLKSGGFKHTRNNFRPVDATYTKESWRGRIRASAGIGTFLEPEQITAFDSEHVALLDRFTSSNTLTVPHIVFTAAGRWIPRHALGSSSAGRWAVEDRTNESSSRRPRNVEPIRAKYICPQTP